jgi:pimeloyl-ACP methyl ester carboxylesterase
MFNENYFDTGELKLNVAEGPASGQPIVFLHGLTGCWQEYQSLLKPFAQKGHVYAPDLRGHGQSGWGERYLLADYSRDIIHLLRGQVSAPALLVGHSWGALTAMQVAALVPKQVRGLILLDPPLCSREVELGSIPEIYDWFAWIYEATRAKRPFSEIAVSLQEMMPGEDEHTVSFLAETIASLDPGTTAMVLNDQTLTGVDLAATIGQISCPTLLLHGNWQQGATVRDVDAAFFQAHMPHADVVKVNAAGHMLHQDQPELVWQQIEQFLNERLPDWLSKTKNKNLQYSI